MSSEFVPYPDCPLVRVDWKVGTDDILYELRKVFGKSHPFLFEKSFDELADNYYTEATDEIVQAFGQEISLHKTALVSIDEGNDEYCLTLVPFDMHKDFCRFVKIHTKNRAILCRQPHKKNGTAAKRIQLSKQLECEEYIMDNNLSSTWSQRMLDFVPGSPYVLRNHRFYKTQGHKKSLFSSWLDVENWPPQAYSCSSDVDDFAFSPEYMLWALLIGVTEEYLPSNKKKLDGFIRITKNPPDEENWQRISFPRGSKNNYADIFFIRDDLFFSQGEKVWVLKGIASLALEDIKPNSWKALLTIKEPKGWHSHECNPYLVTTGDGTRYITAAGKLYSWCDGKCMELPYRVRKGSMGFFVPGDAQSFMYVDEEMRLVALDVKSGKERFRSLGMDAAWITLQDIGEGWFAFLANERTPSSAAIALFWHRESDEWVPLFRGAIGRSAIRHIEPHKEGAVLIYTYERRLFRVFDLIAQARVLRGKKTLDVGAWSDDSEEGSTSWFYPALEAELALTGIRRVESLGDGKVMFSSNEGIFWVEQAEGLWNKLHTERKQKRPAHAYKVFGDGSFVYRVYRMLSADNLALYREYPQEKPPEFSGQEEDASQGGIAQEEGKKAGIAAWILADILFVCVLVYSLVKTLLVKPLAGLVRFIVKWIKKLFKS